MTVCRCTFLAGLLVLGIGLAAGADDVPATLPVGGKVTNQAAATAAWDKLGSKSEEIAAAADAVLRAQGQAGAIFITDRLTSSPNIDDVRKLAANLDSDDFKVRDAAFHKLLAMGGVVKAPLMEVTGKNATTEVAAAVRGIIATLAGMQQPEEEENRREMRGLAIVEQSGDGAETLLNRIGTAAAWKSTCEAAIRSMDRLNREDIDQMIEEAVNAAAASQDFSAITARIQKRLAARFQCDGATETRMRLGLLAYDWRIKVQLQWLDKFKAISAQRRELEKKLAEDPKDVKTRAALVTLLLVELDDPADAAKDAEGSPIDESLTQAAKLAARRIDLLSPEEKQSLAEFYIVAAKMKNSAEIWPALDHAGILLALCLSDVKLDTEHRNLLKNELAAVQAELQEIAAAGH